MNKTLNALFVLIVATPLLASAEVDFYGKMNVTVEQQSIENDSHTALVSNASRVGIKGTEQIQDNLKVVYQAEYEISVDGEGDTHKKRDIFVGLQGDWGTVKAGNMNTPLKQAQGKVDVFNDLAGDIKNVITTNELRKPNSVAYVSPNLSGVTVHVAHISTETETVDNGLSASVVYDQGDIYLAAAVDQNVLAEDVDTIRIAGAYTLGQLTIGGLYETTEDASGESQDGVLGSVKYKLTDHWVVKGQYLSSDQLDEGGEGVSVGADYVFSKTFKVFGFYTMQESEVIVGPNVAEEDYLAVGLEYKF